MDGKLHERSTYSARGRKEWMQVPTLEEFVGRNLNKLGILFLVLGSALAIVWEFQYFTPLMRILSGLVLSLILIAGGILFEKQELMKWYGRALVGGGWSLGYFTTYAAHHFQQARIIDSGLMDLMLLLFVAIGAVCHSLFFKSEMITGMALILGLVTTLISDVSTFTLLSASVLVLTLCILVVRMRWYKLFISGLSTVYLIDLLRVLPALSTSAPYATSAWTLPGLSLSQLSAVTNDGCFSTAFPYLAFTWLAFSTVMLIVGEKSDWEKKILCSAAIINGGAFVLSGLSVIPLGFVGARSSFLIVLSLVYGLSAWLARLRNIRSLDTVHTYLALSTGIAAEAMKLSGDNLSLVWMMQVPMLVAVGLQYRVRALRYSAFVLTLLTLAQVSTYNFLTSLVSNNHASIALPMGALFTVCLAIAAGLYRYFRLCDETLVADHDSFHFYLGCMTMMLVFTVSTNIQPPFLPLACAVAGAIYILVGMQICDRPMRILGDVFILLPGSIAMLSIFGQWLMLPTFAVIGILYGLGARYKMADDDPAFHGIKWIGTTYSMSATVTFTLLLAQLFSKALSAAWAIEGILLLLVGFQFNDKLLRRSGLSVLALAIVKLLAFDLAGAEPIYRTISLLVAGVVLLIASYAYAKLPGANRERAQSEAWNVQ